MSAKLVFRRYLDHCVWHLDHNVWYLDHCVWHLDHCMQLQDAFNTQLRAPAVAAADPPPKADLATAWGSELGLGLRFGLGLGLGFESGSVHVSSMSALCQLCVSCLSAVCQLFVR